MKNENKKMCLWLQDQDSLLQGIDYVADKTEHELIYLEIKWNFVLTWIME